MKLVDTHAHLFWEDYENDLDEVMERARDAGLDAILNLAEQNSLSSVYLLTTNAKAYFERHGFVEVDRDSAPDGIRESWEFRTGCPTGSALLMRPVSSDSPSVP